MAVDSIEFHADTARDATSSRHLVADRLTGWGCVDADAVLLVVSELVTNALVHAGGAQHVNIEHGSGSTTVTVDDESRSPPEMRPDGDGPGGFGLRIVDELATRWGWSPTVTGKRVWAAIDCCG